MHVQTDREIEEEMFALEARLGREIAIEKELVRRFRIANCLFKQGFEGYVRGFIEGAGLGKYTSEIYRGICSSIFPTRRIDLSKDYPSATLPVKHPGLFSDYEFDETDSFFDNAFNEIVDISSVLQTAQDEMIEAVNKYIPKWKMYNELDWDHPMKREDAMKGE